MSTIKVTVDYEMPSTTKFDALMEEYNAAKKMADETVAYYKPLADAAEEAKFDAIMEQLETIKEYAKKIYELRNNNYAVHICIYLSGEERGSKYYSSSSYEFSVSYYPKGEYKITWIKDNFSKQRMYEYHHAMCEGEYNIIGKWDAWGVYKKLETEACSMLKNEIIRQKSRATKQINRLNNIIN